ncbi:MAG: hypothetical protein V1799_19175 [bacterium]
MHFIFVIEKSTGAIIDKNEIEETTSGNRLDDELSFITEIARKQIERKYPSPQYEVVSYTGPNLDHVLAAHPELNPQRAKVNFRMEGSRKSLLIVNASGLMIGIVLIILLSIARQFAWSGFIILACTILFFYMLIDYILWEIRGIKLVEIDEEGVTFYRGIRKRKVRIEATQITGIDEFKKLHRKVVNILLGGEAEKVLPGVTIFAGPRLRITNDAFRDLEFNQFIERIRALHGKSSLTEN